MRFILKLSPVIGGLALAWAAMGLYVEEYSRFFHFMCGTVSVTIILGLLLRLLIDAEAMLSELSNVLMLSTLPPFFMANMVLSNYLAPYYRLPALIWWLLAASGHLLLMIYFSLRYLKNYDIGNVLPSWLLIYASYAIIGTTSAAFGLQELVGKFIFLPAFIGYMVTAVLVIYRTIAIRDIPDRAKPGFANFLGAINVVMISYLTCFDPPSTLFVRFFFVLSMLIAICYLSYMRFILKLAFYPGYAGLTFPLVAFATGLKKLDETGLILNQGTLMPLSAVAFLLALGMLLFVSVRYAFYLDAISK